MYLVRNLAFKMVFDFCSCSGATTLAPLSYVSCRLILSAHAGTCHTTLLQIRQVLCKACSNYSTFNGLKSTSAMFMPNSWIRFFFCIWILWPKQKQIICVSKQTNWTISFVLFFKRITLKWINLFKFSKRTD